MMKLQKIIDTHKNELLAMENVVGVGVGNKIVGGVDTGEEAVVIFVVKKKSETELKAESIVPMKVDDAPTDVVEVGTLRLLGTERTSYQRPASPGVSVGHYMSTAGTLGAIVYDKKTNEPYILSNNHVIANINDGSNGRSKLGDPILQPGPYDGGTVEKNTIANLVKFVPIHSIHYGNSNSGEFIPTDEMYRSKSNKVDCALAKPVSPDAVSPEVMGLGKVNGTAEAGVGTKVVKSGRTSEVTKGKVTAVNATLKVNFDENEYGIFEGQMVSNMKSLPGDSGSIVVDGDNRAVGLLFAGSDTATIINPIKSVCDSLDVYIPDIGPVSQPVNTSDGIIQVAVFLILFLILFSNK
jgi:hypothetical protein